VAVAAFSVVVVTALWVAGGGIQDLTAGAGPALISFGRITGLIGADLLLVQVLLMARIGLIEQAFGQDDLARRHRIVGFTSLTLMFTHVLAIVLGYAVASSTNPLRELWDMVVGFPGMLLAAAGTLLLVMVAITSTRRARRHLRYESWHLLHLYAYLGAGLALPHQLWTGQEFLTSSAATFFWWTAWGLAVAAFVIWRLGLPLYRTLLHGLRVVAVDREGPGVVSVRMRGRSLHRLPVAAGQFFIWRFGGPGVTRAHPYSLSAAPTADALRITVKDLGDGSGALARVRPGARVIIEGPYGRLHLGTRTRRRITLMGSGIGITPIRAILEDLPASPGDITVVYRASRVQDLVLSEELDALAASRAATLYYVVGHRIRGRTSWLPRSAAHLSDVDALRDLVPDIEENDVYVCGPAPWTDAVRAAARRAGTPPEHIHVERFTW
jgi:predicted ferric reductase